MFRKKLMKEKILKGRKGRIVCYMAPMYLVQESVASPAAEVTLATAAPGPVERDERLAQHLLAHRVDLLAPRFQQLHDMRVWKKKQ